MDTTTRKGITTVYKNMTPGHPERISQILGGLVLLDVTLAITGFFFPRFWFLIFHGVEYVDPQALLPRTAASWAAFALFQGIALKYWKVRPEWLAVVAGIRLSDMFTDWTYLALCQNATWFAKASLLTTSPANAIIGWYLLKAYRGRSAHAH